MFSIKAERAKISKAVRARDTQISIIASPFQSNAVIRRKRDRAEKAEQESKSKEVNFRKHKEANHSFIHIVNMHKVSDIGSIKVNQKLSIRSSMTPAPITGRVSHVRP